MNEKILVAGATGFVGLRLVDALEKEGETVVCTSRSPERARHALGDREIRRLDMFDRDSIAEAMSGCQVAYYLVHGMRDAKNYDVLEAKAAKAFAETAAAAGLRRIVYLGGVTPVGHLSRHLESRMRTGQILRGGAVPTIELRAGMIVGGGSESWRIVRDIAARLPLMIFPRWLDSESEPVAISDVIAALCRARLVPLEQSACYDLPGPERISGCDVIVRTSRLLGGKPRALRVPVVTPRLSGYWIRLVTRANPRVAFALVEGLRSNLVSSGKLFWDLMPDHERRSFDEAARIALDEEAQTLPPAVRRTEEMLRTLPWASQVR